MIAWKVVSFHGVRSPESVAKGDLEGCSYVVTSRVSGRSLDAVWPEMTRSNRLEVAAELGRITRELHDLSIDDEKDYWGPFWASCCSDDAGRHAQDDVPRELSDSIPLFLESRGVPDSTARVLLHTEILDQHVLAVERDDRFVMCAMIDFADGRIGLPEYEFAAPVEFVFRGESGLLRAFLEAYGENDSDLIPERSERMLAWSFHHRYGSLRRMLQLIAPWTPATLSDLARRLYGLESRQSGCARWAPQIERRVLCGRFWALLQCSAVVECVSFPFSIRALSP